MDFGLAKAPAAPAGELVGVELAGHDVAAVDHGRHDRGHHSVHGAGATGR
jgi:hypothetical protein